MVVLLVHGAFRGGWSWGRVAARLAVFGHRVLAPDLPGAGARWRPEHPPVGISDCLDALESLAVEQDLGDLVVVGHSQGGVVAEALLQRIPDRIAVVGHLDAPVPVHGQRAVDLVPPGMQPPPAEALDPAAWVPAAPLDPNVLGVGPLTAARWSRRLTPLSMAMALEPVVLDRPEAADVPRRYAWCAGTPETFPAWHTRSARSGAGDPVLDAPHDAPLARPDLVADWIENALVAA